MLRLILCRVWSWSELGSSMAASLSGGYPSSRRCPLGLPRSEGFSAVSIPSRVRRVMAGCSIQSRTMAWVRMSAAVSLPLVMT